MESGEFEIEGTNRLAIFGEGVVLNEEENEEERLDAPLVPLLTNLCSEADEV